MALTAENQRFFHQHLYGPCGVLEVVSLYVRGDDQRQGQVTVYTARDCRRKKEYNVGEPVRGDMRAGTRTTWQVPRAELDRLGINYLNVLVKIVDSLGRHWQNERDEAIQVQLFRLMLNVDCVLRNPA